jgi:hypothetical protein
MTYSVSTPQLGWVQIANIDAGVLPPSATSSGSTTYVPTPPLVPGQIVTAVDPTYGSGEFILLAGVASTAVGSLVIYNTTSFTTTLAPVTANLAQPLAVAMSANTSATNWGWYQIGGVAVVAKSTNINFAPNVTVGLRSTGKVGGTSSGKEIQGARTANAATVASATTTISVMINRPHAQGRVS